MWQHFRSLRFKLATLYVVVFGLILTVLCLIILNVWENLLRQDFDGRLKDRAEAMAERIMITAEDREVSQTAKPALPRLNPFRFPGYYFQLRLDDGTIAERSINLGKQVLPLSDAARATRTTRTPVLETLRETPAPELIGAETAEIRLLTLYHDRTETRPFYLQVAVNLRQATEPVEKVRDLFFLMIPVGLVMAVVASWLLAHRYLAPIGKIALEAEQMGVHNLSRRFDQPRGGTEIAVMVGTINRMLDRLAEAFQSLERFIADVSHELKTPLSVLLGEAQVLHKRPRLPEDYHEFVGSVEDEARVLGQTVDSLLALARADAGLPVAFTSEVPINEAVMNAVERCQTLAAERQVRLVPQLAAPKGDESGPVITGDAELLALAFTNLLRNAIRYSPPKQAVEIKVEFDGVETAVFVRDHGPGVPPEYIDRIFDRFFRVPGREGKFQGMGLGLTIVRGVARLHGGNVSVANLAAGGCEFVMRLPMTEQQ